MARVQSRTRWEYLINYCDLSTTLLLIPLLSLIHIADTSSSFYCSLLSALALISLYLDGIPIRTTFAPNA